eukprot:4335180-Heterocapsa_arctica.AAC.1
MAFIKGKLYDHSMLAQNIGRKTTNLFGAFGTLLGSSSLSPLKSSQAADHFTTNLSLRCQF